MESWKTSSWKREMFQLSRPQSFPPNLCSHPQTGSYMILPELTHSTVTVTHQPLQTPCLGVWTDRTLSFHPQHHHLCLYSQLPVEFSSTEDEPNPSESQVELRVHLARPMRKWKTFMGALIPINSSKELCCVLGQDSSVAWFLGITL